MQPQDKQRNYSTETLKHLLYLGCSRVRNSILEIKRILSKKWRLLKTNLLIEKNTLSRINSLDDLNSQVEVKTKRTSLKLNKNPVWRTEREKTFKNEQRAPGINRTIWKDINNIHRCILKFQKNWRKWLRQKRYLDSDLNFYKFVGRNRCIDTQDSENHRKDELRENHPRT